MRIPLNLLLLMTSASIFAQSNISLSVAHARIQGDITGTIPAIHEVSYSAAEWGGVSVETDYWHARGFYIGAGVSQTEIEYGDFEICLSDECHHQHVKGMSVSEFKELNAHIDLGYNIRTDFTPYIRFDYTDLVIDFGRDFRPHRNIHHDTEWGMGLLYNPASANLLFDLTIEDISDDQDGYLLSSEIQWRLFHNNGVVFRLREYIGGDDWRQDGGVINFDGYSTLSLGYVRYF